MMIFEQQQSGMQMPMMMPLYQGGQTVAWHDSSSLSLSLSLG